MDEIRLENYRCFKSEQRARIAPLTILVGENSTGKSSFLAMVRVLWNLYYNHRVPNFNEEPFDFGTFNNIAFFGNEDGDTSKTFSAGFRPNYGTHELQEYLPIWFEVEFGKRGTAPFPTKLTMKNLEKNLKITLNSSDDNLAQVDIQTNRGSWRSKEIPKFTKLFEENRLAPFPLMLKLMKPVGLTRGRGITLGAVPEIWSEDRIDYTAVLNNRFIQISENDWQQIEKLLDAIYLSMTTYDLGSPPPFASSPVRSKPIRIYQPKLFAWDSEGNFVPMYFAYLYETERHRWRELKAKLEVFGSQSGLFDRISIRRYEEQDGGPFQVEVRRSGGHYKGKKRNLIDIGYGVSQILPVATELLRDDPTPLLLLQQPEVHLHPSAQAALGTLLLQTAQQEQIIIVESHSDHLLNRIRMDLRDGVGDSRPEDVSILYFESSDLESKIHSLRIDEEGNVMDAPESYGRFFMDETKRSLNL